MEESRQHKPAPDNTLNKATEDKSQGLGLSKIIYGLGTSARDALVWTAGITAVFTPVIYYGRNFKPIDWLAKIPSQVETWFKTKLGGERSGRIGSAFAVALGLGILVSHFAQLPGLIAGPRKVQKANDLYDQEVRTNQMLLEAAAALKQDKKILEEDKRLLNEELAKLKESRPSMVERVQPAPQEMGMGGIG